MVLVAILQAIDLRQFHHVPKFRKVNYSRLKDNPGRDYASQQLSKYRYPQESCRKLTIHQRQV